MRRTQRVTITAEGRDKGKIFLLTEMPSDQGERWAVRAILALANAGAKVPDGVLDAGMAGLATMAGIFVKSLQMLQGLSYEAAQPLLDEMMDCVQFCSPNPAVPPQPLYRGENCQIEEIRTYLTLRWEVLQVHTDFSLADALSKLRVSTPAPPAS